MTVTVVCDVLGEENNGTTVATMNLVRYLKSRGDTVRILCADQNRKEDENVFVVSNIDFGILLNAFIDKVGVSLAKPDEDIIRNAIIGADVVHIMFPLQLGIVSVRIATELGIPVTAGFHMQAQNFTAYFKLNNIKTANKQVYRFIYDHVYKYAAAIHYPTEFIKNQFEKSIKKETPGFVVSNGVNHFFRKLETEKPVEFKDKIVILTTGRYAREKSQDTLIRAIKQSKYKNRIQLILAGQGFEELYYKILSKDLPIAPIFKLYSREEMLEVINYCNIYAHPAIIELEGISCLEAIRCGKLTIVSNSKLSATHEFAVDEKCIFRARSPRSLAKAIDYWIEHPEEKKACEKKYLASSEKFNQELCMHKTREILLNAAKVKSPELY
ncbi:MAG: glycosyltransferase [Eubacterium sp.]|nr:glycosyltransferase [Eubacterium sp.]